MHSLVALSFLLISLGFPILLDPSRGVRAGGLPVQRLRLQRRPGLARTGGDMRARGQARGDLRGAGWRALQAGGGPARLFRQGSAERTRSQTKAE
jgi:hypothetical protein